MELQKGRALVEVAEIHPVNNVRINQDKAGTQLMKPGLYEFDANLEESSRLTVGRWYKP